MIPLTDIMKNKNNAAYVKTDYQMLLMIEEKIRGGMCQSTHRCAKVNNKYMKNFDKKLSHHI